MYFRTRIVFNWHLLFLGFILLLQFSNVNAVQYAIESDVAARVEYNDNIFVTSEPHDSVYGLTIIPKAKMVAKEANWETFLKGKLRSNNYSDHNLDSNDIYLDASGDYRMERNVFTLTGLYHMDSNLNALSTDFGLTGRRVNRKLWSIVPQYQRLLTERLSFFASYNHTDVDYIDAEDTGYVPYSTDTLSGSFVYGLTERDKLSFILQATDYASKNGALEYQLFISRVGIEHNLSEIWSVDINVGGSRRNSSNQFTQLDGELITFDSSDKGYVLDAGFARKMETGSLSGQISRDYVPNSFGGLNVVDTLRFGVGQNMSALWRYNIDARYENFDAVSTVTRSTDREVLFFEPRIFYKIDRHWTANASYRYIQRKFKSDTSDDRAPHSNRIYIGMTYNFPDISTF